MKALLRLAGVSALVVALAAPLAHAAVRLPHIFGSHMVLQRDKEIPVWGWAAAGEEVRVQLGDKPAVTARADAAGKWTVRLPALPASATPVALKVSGTNEITVDDILIGEVWICSGQSNMEWILRNCDGAPEEMAAANYPQLRHIGFPKRPSGYPMDDIDASWTVCTPEVCGGFTAVGYYFGKYLMNQLKVPVGLINTSWGGTAIEPWTPPTGFRQVPALDGLYKTVLATDPRSDLYKQTLDDYQARHEAWRRAAAEARAAEKPLEPAPDYPGSLKPLVGPGGPSTLYNGMVQPFVPFAVRGAIWYQGESNHSQGMGYRDRTEALLRGWREAFGQGDFPFYFVQIAPYHYGTEDPGILPVFWEAQEACVKTIPNVGMAVIHDVGNYNDIHPRNKLAVGTRLALLALKGTYGRTDVVASGPTFRSLGGGHGRLRVRFDNLGSGLASRDGKPLDWFEIIDAKEGGWEPAQAAIVRNTVVLSSPRVRQPVAVRFAWAKNAAPNLMNKEGLPAGAFRAGEVPKRDYLVLSVPEAKNYELVYSLDLSKTGPEPTYTIDNHAKLTQPFDRVAYFLELGGADGKVNWVYVSMDAFTGDIGKIGLPSVGSKINFQKRVTNLNVLSNVPGVVTGTGIGTGNIEFWPNNYGTPNSAGIPGASADKYDFGDQCVDPVEGYGCMQVHNYGARQVIFAVNCFRGGAANDLGIGNSTGEHPDYTFSGNGGNYTLRNLRVLVRVKK